MYVIGITGGVGAGKSNVMQMLQGKELSLRAAGILADEVGHEVMEPGEKGFRQIVELFGEEVLDADGRIDRSALADIVFKDQRKRMVLNSIIHPLVKKKITERIGMIRCEEQYDFVFVEAALLIEEHYEAVCDELWFVYAPEEVRRQRLKESRGYTDVKIDEIFASQLSEEEFRRHCSQVIDNSGKDEDTLTQLKEIVTGYGECR